MTRPIALCLLGLLFAGTGGPVLAQGTAEFTTRCFSNLNPDQLIQACTALIDAGLVNRNDMATAFKNRGNAFDDKGEFARAIQDYDHAIAINPKDADALNDRGTSQRARGEYELAIKDYDDAIALDMHNGMILNNRCAARALVGRLDEALSDCNASLKVLPNNHGTLASRGLTYLKMKRYAEAIADYDAELLLNPGNSYTLFGRGVAKRMNGDAAGGDKDIEAAKLRKTDIVETMTKIGVTL